LGTWLLAALDGGLLGEGTLVEGMTILKKRGNATLPIVNAPGRRVKGVNHRRTREIIAESLECGARFS
jgi:hypothetical protein